MVFSFLSGLILNGLKTIETRWTPVFKELENQTIAIHIAQRTWEGEEWRDALHLRGLSDVQIDCMVAEAEQHGRGVIAGECLGRGIRKEQRGGSLNKCGGVGQS